MGPHCVSAGGEADAACRNWERDISKHMRITVRLDDALLEQAKREAARRGESLTALIEQGLRLVLAQSRPRERRRRGVVLPTCRAGGGVLPGIELNDSTALLDIVEYRR
jgi:hypothetical protein